MLDKKFTKPNTRSSFQPLPLLNSPPLKWMDLYHVHVRLGNEGCV